MEKSIINSLTKENNSEVIFHLLKLYFGIVNNTKNKYINETLVDILIDIIKRDINEKTNLVCCFFCEKIFEEKVDDLINKLDKIGFREILENWSLSTNEELKNSSSYLLENYNKYSS